MLIQNMNIGQEIWYRHNWTDTDGKIKHEYGKGTVQEIHDEPKNRRITVNTEDGREWALKPYDCYEDEFSMKMDRAADKFEDGMIDFADKYVNQCKGIMEKIVGNTVPQGQLMVNDLKLRMQMIGSQLRDRFSGQTDDFIKETHDIVMDDINEGMQAPDIGIDDEGPKDDPMAHVDDLKEDGELTLTAEDLDFGPQEPGLKL